MADRIKVVVSICTFERNEPLTRLLDALLLCADHCKDRAMIGVVVIDDTVCGGASPIVEAFRGRFELGIVYRISGKQNISVARNLGLEAAAPLGDWVAMTDDDCEPRVEWLSALLAVQQATSGDAITGLMVRRVPPGSPNWIVDEPFLSLGAPEPIDGKQMDTAFTNNALVSSDWLLTNSGVRFDPKLGKLGGEDMAFFRAAHEKGLRIYFSAQGYVYENEPPSRVTLRYQLRRFYWHGNSSYVTMLEQGHSPFRAFIHGVAQFARAVVYPLRRLSRSKSPQLRYSLALLLLSLGLMLGIFGVRVRHK